MNPIYFFSAILDDPEQPLPPISTLSPQTKERLIILGAIAVIMLGAFIWAAFIRKRRKRKPHYHRHSNSSLRNQATAAKEELTRMIQQRAQEKERRRRVRHRPRNPTLADTGGLPPPRPASDSDSPSTNGQSHPR